MTCLTDNQSKIYSEKPASYSWTVSQSVAAKGEEDEAGWRITMWQILHAKLVEWCASVGVIKRINICICTHPKHTKKQHNGKCWFFPLKKKKSITPVLITWSYQMWILDFKSSACCQVDNSQQNLEAISFIAPIWHYTRLQILPEEIEQDFAMPAENIGS